MSMSLVDRVYKLTRLRKGDYLLPSNDAHTLWRISSYEDGPSHGIIEWPRDRIFWRLSRWDGGFPTIDQLAAALEDDWYWSDRWDEVGGGFSTRTEAIEAALRHG